MEKNKTTKWVYAMVGFVFGIIFFYLFAISVNYSVLQDIGIIEKRKTYINDDGMVPNENEYTGLDLNPGSN